MSSEPELITGAAVLVAALAITTGILLSSDITFADDGAAVASRCCQTVPELTEQDRHLALSALHSGLSETGDGESYVWRAHGRLAGVVRPLSSFKDGEGRICRHVVLAMSAPGRLRQIEGIACRLADGGWRLDG